MTFYYKGMLEILLRQFADSRLSIEKSLKLSEDYSWKLLYLKGISEFSC